MADSNAPQTTLIGTDEDPTRGLPYHDKITADLKGMLARRRILERNVAAMDEAIYKRETEYLEDTPYGNILTGFDSYIKGTSSNAPGARRKTGVDDNNRVFSRSSVRFGDATDSPTFSSTHSTPHHSAHPNSQSQSHPHSASHAPTPLNTSFPRRDDASASNNATPTSATSGLKKKDKKDGKKEKEEEDSEMDTKDGKKRTNFGAGGRK